MPVQFCIKWLFQQKGFCNSCWMCYSQLLLPLSKYRCVIIQPSISWPAFYLLGPWKAGASSRHYVGCGLADTRSDLNFISLNQSSLKSFLHQVRYWLFLILPHFKTFPFKDHWETYWFCLCLFLSSQMSTFPSLDNSWFCLNCVTIKVQKDIHSIWPLCSRWFWGSWSCSTHWAATLEGGGKAGETKQVSMIMLCVYGCGSFHHVVALLCSDSPSRTLKRLLWATM